MKQVQAPDVSVAHRGDTLTKRDMVVGSIIALVLSLAFASLSSGSSLRVTFVPGMLVSWAVFLWLYRSQTSLPDARRLMPLFFATLAIQFLHFAEEFATGFATFFPKLYGGEPYSQNLFVAFNMTAYAVFTLACLLLCYRRIGFMLMPVLFFAFYGAAGNAIAHSWWSIDAFAYRPGLITAQAYWFAAPLLIGEIVGSQRLALIMMSGWGVLLIALLKLFALA
jgi:hypothetical protein